MKKLKFLDFIKPKTIQLYLVYMVTGMVLVQIGITWFLVSDLTSNILKEQIGLRALQTSQAVAEVPMIREMLLKKDPEGQIQAMAEDIRLKIGATFVVVGDSAGIRYSHPVPERIGKYFVGGDTGPVLMEGKSYVSEAVGTLGPSIRSFVPVFGAPSEIIGFVSVGYLTENVQKNIAAHLDRPLWFVLGLTLIGFFSTAYISRHLKKVTLNLEPAEITNLYLERGAVLETIREGVIATDHRGEIRLANKAALKYTCFNSAELVGKMIGDVIPCAGLNYALTTGEGEYDQERIVNGQELIFNIVPVLQGGEIKGLVASFRRKDELDRIAHELSSIQEYSELLRGQTHEYSNKLHTIAGLIQIEAYQEALDLVTCESSGYEDLIMFLNKAIPHPVIAAIVLGKFNRAKELKVQFDVDREGTMVDVPDWIKQEKIVTIVGNLLDNAFEAVLGCDKVDCKVQLSFTDLGNDIVFEVEDSGPGIPPDQIDHIFEKGISSKGTGRRGLGLYLVKQRLDELGGFVSVSSDGSEGTLFSVIIPKIRRSGI
ncbi:two-component system, CitB family, sensor histidine kinase DcuS [Maridesulfovibrio ferrireducens]|uniref:histidine kinase n=1 Tax=Maridesulfovibrio ferrireducens TaxID=246191 RepID=A0A1G9FR95_9BACT|nr:sensor histidine kinase [Maridesulfovibrio ferrireducens]SDK90931.1 two-component system, CitB family, sensor histidine kinase DcuS [Maridesulfovibrio ferrireducens]